MLKENNDSLFTEFVNNCMSAIKDCDNRSVQDKIANIMKDFINKWNMPDERYRQFQNGEDYGSYLLFLNPEKTLSVVIDTFAPGQVTGIHNHGVWGVFGCMAGSERQRSYAAPSANSMPIEVSTSIMFPGDVQVTDENGEDFHQVECASDVPSISLHVYGADIGRVKRLQWDPKVGGYVEFSSDYSNESAGLGVYLENGSFA